ncbi:MAG: MnhB domain-containing protein [Acidimicrobiia bacterium]
MKPARSVILEQGLRATFHTILLFAVFIFFAGHNAPGGGFPAGLVAGSALVLRYVTYGTDGLPRLAPEFLCGFGLVLSAATGFGSWFLGGQFLESDILEFHLPAIGEVHMSTVAFFDLGVFFIVVGIVIGILTFLGREPEDARAEGEPGAAP